MAINLEEKVKELEAKVADLYDREALRDLRYRYHECINEAQTAEIPDLFTEDGELDFGHLGKAKGREQIKAFFSGLGRDASAPDSRRGLYRVRQFIHNHVLKVNGDRASGYAYLEAKPVYNGESYVVAARYNDEYLKRDGRWRFSKMSLTPFFMVPLKEGWAGDDLLKMGRQDQNYSRHQGSLMMLTLHEQDIIRRWNQFYLKPAQGSLLEQRARLADYFEEFNANPPVIGAYHEGVRLKAELDADIAVPKGSAPFPVVIYIHGGAWTRGSSTTHRKLVKQFAEAGYLTIAPNYRLAPENPFPAGFDDCVFTAHWAAENAGRFGGDATRMAMGGDSAGGNLTAAAFTAIASSQRGPKFKAAILIYGAFDLAGLVAMAKEAAEPLAKAYLGANYPAGLNDPRVSPIRAIKPGAMPPSFIIAGTADSIVGESRTVAGAISRAGIENELHIIEEMPHAFMQMTELGGCREGLRLMFDFLRRHV